MAIDSNIDYKENIIHIAKRSALLGVLATVLSIFIFPRPYPFWVVEFVVRMANGCCMAILVFYRNPRKTSADYYLIDRDNWRFFKLYTWVWLFLIGCLGGIAIIKLFLIW